MKIIYPLLFSFFLVFLFTDVVDGQLLSTCPNSNFNLGNFTNWTG